MGSSSGLAVIAVHRHAHTHPRTSRRTHVSPVSPPSILSSLFLACPPDFGSMTAAQKRTGWTCLNDPERQRTPPPEPLHRKIRARTPVNATQSRAPLPLLASGPEQRSSDDLWRVYGFPERDSLLFSSKSELHTLDTSLRLDLRPRSWSEGSGTPGMEEAYKHVRRYRFPSCSDFFSTSDSGRS